MHQQTRRIKNRVLVINQTDGEQKTGKTSKTWLFAKGQAYLFATYLVNYKNPILNSPCLLMHLHLWRKKKCFFVYTRINIKRRLQVSSDSRGSMAREDCKFLRVSIKKWRVNVSSDSHRSMSREDCKFLRTDLNKHGELRTGFLYLTKQTANK